MLKVIYRVFLLISLLMLSACLHDEESAPPPSSSISISGTISTAQISVVDSDVNDLGSIYTSNDTIAKAQFLPNPVILGGYVNLPGKGPTPISNGSPLLGGSHLVGDVADIYKVILAEGEIITLTIGEPVVGYDIQLLIIDENKTIRNRALRNVDSQSVSLTVTAADIDPSVSNYFVVVALCSDEGITGIECRSLPANSRDYSNYNLHIGPGGTQGAALANVDLNSDFIPGEIVVKYKQDFISAPLSAAVVNTLSNVAGAMGLSVKSGAMNRVSLLSLGDTTTKQKTALSVLGISAAALKVTAVKSDPKRQLKLDTLLAIQALRQNASVEYAEPNFIYKTFRVPNDTFYDRQWHYPLINLPQAWEFTTGLPANGLSPVIVAVIDSGLLLNHPDIQNQTVNDGYDFILDPNSAGDGDGIDNNPNDPGDKKDLSGSSSFHGTHVAGTIAASSNNNTGVAGIGWNVKIMPIRVIGRNDGTSFDVLQGLRYAARLSNTSGTLPQQQANIVNLSLGGGGFSQSMQDTILEMRAKGVIIVAAAGNSASADPSYPAAYSGVISVGAVGADKRLAPYSNFGSTIDIAAPGGDSSQDFDGDGRLDGVLSLLGQDSGGSNITYGYGFYEGTSMAAPHVAGVLALMLAVNKDITPAAIDLKIESGEISDDIGLAGKDNLYGHGLINALKAVVSASNEISSVGGVLATSNSRVNFGATASILTFTLLNLGDAALQVLDITTDQPWLTVAEGAGVGADGLGNYIVSIDRSNLAFGSYAATITITTVTNNSISISVVMKKSDPNFVTSVSAGQLYLLVADPTKVSATSEGYLIVAQTAPLLVNGSYKYSIDNVPQGSYLLFAGSDLDNDLSICNKLDSCGAYGGRALPSLVTLTSGATNNLNFSVNFEAGLVSQTLNQTSGDPGQFTLRRQAAPLVRSNRLP